MMKKNLFLVFSLYFFVLQSIFLGLLRGDTRFFLLAGINLIFILLISLIFRDKTTSVDVDSQTTGTEQKSYDVENAYNVGSSGYKKVKKKRQSIIISHIWFFVISILFGFIVWFWLGDMVLHLHLLFSVFLSFCLFILFGFLFRFRSFRVWESKLYFVVLIILLILSIIRYFDINLLSLDMDNMNITGDIVDNTPFVSVAMDLSGIINVDDVQGSAQLDDKNIDLEKKATFEEVIIQLLDDKFDLNNAKNIKFTYIPYGDKNYSYYRTAYDHKMIGKNIQPDKNLLCETYVVMKGLSVKWPISSYVDIKKAYWNYAKMHDYLPDCEYGSYLKLGDLK